MNLSISYRILSTQIYILFPINTFIFVHVDHFVFYDLCTLRNSRGVNHSIEFLVNHPKANRIFFNHKRKEDDKLIKLSKLSLDH